MRHKKKKKRNYDLIKLCFKYFPPLFFSQQLKEEILMHRFSLGLVCFLCFFLRFVLLFCCFLLLLLFYCSIISHSFCLTRTTKNNKNYGFSAIQHTHTNPPKMTHNKNYKQILYPILFDEFIIYSHTTPLLLIIFFFCIKFISLHFIKRR